MELLKLGVWQVGMALGKGVPGPPVGRESTMRFEPLTFRLQDDISTLIRGFYLQQQQTKQIL